MTGRLAEALECCETALEAVRVSSRPHELYRALFELGWTRYFSGDLDGAIAAVRGEPARRSAHGRRHDSERRRRAGLGARRRAGSTPGEVERGRSILLELGGEDVARTMPVERCFDWESLTLVELAVGNAEAADGYARRAEEDAARLGLKLPAALADRSRAAVLLARGRAASRRRASPRRSVGGRDRRSAHSLHVAFSRGLEGRALAAAGERTQAIATLRRAEKELDACGSIRARDELRRELRRLGARAEARGPAAEGQSGVASLTKRELEIANARHRP